MKLGANIQFKGGNHNGIEGFLAGSSSVIDFADGRPVLHAGCRY
jgi:hypothetical protein